MYKNSYAKFVQLRPVYQYCITFAVITGVCFSWIYGIYKPLQNLLREERQKINTYKLQKDELKTVRAAIQKAKHEITQLEHAIAGNKIQEESELYIQKQTLFILQALKEANLSLHSYVADKPIDKQWCIAYPAQYSIQGTLAQMEMFLQKIQQSERMIECDQIHINNIQADRYNMISNFKIMVVN